MAAIDAGRQRNPGVPQEDDGAPQKVAHYWTQFKHKALSLVSDEPPADEALLTQMPEEPGYMDGLSEMTDLSYTQRISGFLMMMGMGILFVLLGLFLWMSPKRFAFFTTCGNVFCVCSTMFLAGAKQQLQTMFQANRFEAACLYLVSVALTLVSAVWLKSSLLCIVFALVQLGCVLWYALSFLPYARQTIKVAVGYASMVFGPIVNGMVKGVSACFAAVLG
ncbi:hypothetical protein ABB37_09884 [Leptomonas pyrrhocoris]|uniref:Vesicle transport protein n=1 Tax=Leptomonas pyrrhocoris TaxID=157538 RepID=A0A0M9FPP8_LEPPY|nr:hypothetical protein ABB37_09884 [Leptomonas pyrrhocoris]XP_015651882.1 hypothetical protein ABB37_09884 [Leptomonas pyrrhocoris]KPA73442.1 hypothetical protein ABB37_09884 [Leptomonas pyrrhocoris]KPA73443.1 hypothetical protein ABB37_09884 [Leptomonas pyrrhocoris]|eukprot:XP_015651881.1 hypothetical protein ABB37_09884 [Leptomonas pyrrhocoris]